MEMHCHCPRFNRVWQHPDKITPMQVLFMILALAVHTGLAVLRPVVTPPNSSNTSLSLR